MKKQIFLAAAVAAMMMALPLSALAGVVGSPHDLPLRYSYTGATAKQGTCSFCHVPHKAQSGGEKLFPVTADTNANNAWGTNDTLSLICWYCHGAGTQFGSAEQVNPFSSNGHKRNVATLTGWGDSGGLNATTFKLASDNNLRCVSCHSIHDNTRRPFLAWGTAAGDFSATATGFCSACHSARSNAGSIGPANPGNHPSATAMTDNGTNSPLTAATLPLIMQVDFATLTTTSAIGAPWNLGGHALYSGGEQAGTFNCGSCHAVHMNETTDWASLTDAGTAVSSALSAAGNNILVSNDNPVAAGGNEAVCIACHSVAATRGPGATGTGSHPFNTDSALGASMVTASRGYRWGTGTGAVIQCQSCHDIHWTTTGHTNSTGAVALAGDYLIAYACSDCHSAAGTTTGYENHHPSNITVTQGTTVKSAPTTSSATDWAALTQTPTATTYFGGSAGNLMNCETCHGLGNAHAHNNAGGTFPALAGDNSDSGMCVDCHTFNPSTYTGHSTAGLATHYVGTIKTAGYKKTSSFTASADNVAKWSADGGGDGSIICESCHTLKMNGKNGHVITYATSANVNDGQASTSDSVRLLLEVSGNDRVVAAAADGMCTECHGAAPGAGVTHPVQPAWTADATAKITVTGGASLTAGTSGKIVCESCHRPHDAATDSAAWILEAATAKTGYTDYSTLCNLCHPQGN